MPMIVLPLFPSQELLSDANPMVVANALASLQEIQEISGRDMLQLNQNTLMKVWKARSKGGWSDLGGTFSYRQGRMGWINGE